MEGYLTEGSKLYREMLHMLKGKVIPLGSVDGMDVMAVDCGNRYVILATEPLDRNLSKVCYQIHRACVAGPEDANLDRAEELLELGGYE
jgi:hypothetical protein